MNTTLQMAVSQFKRVIRDPITLIVLFSIPALLLLIFGAFTRNTDNISMKVALVNNSEHQLAKSFADGVKKVTVFKETDKKYSLDEAKQHMRDNKLDAIIELPASFGAMQDGKPAGKAKVYLDQADRTNGDIVMSVMEKISSEANKNLLGASFPVSLEKVSIEGKEAKIFDGLFAMFTGMAIMMVGIFGVASAIPADKKMGVLRRLRVTPLKSRQLILGTILAYAVVGVLAVALMTILALTIFDLEMRGNWLEFGIFTLVSLALMLGFGLAIGGWSKNSTQADVYGQIVFITSLGFSGLWIPRALMPEWLQELTTYLPLTPIVDGIRSIVVDGAHLLALGTELAIIIAWMLIVFVVGIKTFRWE
ncbi:MAG TPA: ABC transporter permease [Verrucomicrobiae bacterium]|nr:ABC transporter permease [Verrucomicrobiae bacterium]